MRLSTSDVGQMANCSSQTVRSAIKRGELVAQRVGLQFFIQPDVGRAWALHRIRVPKFSDFCTRPKGVEFALEKYGMKACDLDRLVKDIFTEPNSGCWLWNGTWFESGRGQFPTGMYEWRKVRIAHRVVYEVINGPVPDGLVLDHLCRVPCCVNPQHLEPVTQAVNTQRGSISRGGVNRNRRTHCKAGHPYSEFRYITPAGRRGYCKACRRVALKQ